MKQATSPPAPAVDPAAAFASPADLAASPHLTRREKESLLRRWEADARALEKAEGEGMPARGGSRLAEVRAALTTLLEGPPPARGTPAAAGPQAPAATPTHPPARRRRDWRQVLKRHANRRHRWIDAVELGIVVAIAALSWFLFGTVLATVLGAALGFVVARVFLWPPPRWGVDACATCGGGGFVEIIDEHGLEVDETCPDCKGSGLYTG